MRYVATETVPVGALEAYPGNARVHDEAALDESARTNGQYRSVVARRLEDGSLQLLAGHGTVGAFRRQGAAEVRVEVIEADDTEARRIVLADNGTSRGASYDESLLLDLLDAASKDGGLGGTGWDGEAYNELLDTVGSENPFDFDPGGDADDFDEEPPEEPVTQPGDVWILGPHRLVCGDSTAPAVWDALLGRAKVDLVWTDPPYGVSYQSDLTPEEAKRLNRRTDGKVVSNDTLTEAGLQDFLRASLGAALAASKPGACWYVAAPSGQQFLDFAVVLREFDVWRQTLVWVKDVFAFGRSDYHYRHESIFYGWKPGAAHQAVPDRTQDTVWEVARPKKSPEHPTMKPVELITRALENSSKKGQIVADPFAGSGSTLLACHVAGRRGRGIELDPRYCDVIARRYQDLTGDLPVLERTGERFDFHGSDGPVAVAA